jgi:hypothetical protein
VDPVVVDDQQPGFSGVVAKPYRIQEMGVNLNTSFNEEAHPTDFGFEAGGATSIDSP